MSCAEVRDRLLRSERPDKPGAEESRHLSGCPACHAWLRRLVRLERKITELAVPTSAAPASLLEQITEEAEQTPLVRPRRVSDKVRDVREVGRQKLALAFSLAATLTLFTLAWWAWPPRTAVPPIETRWPAAIKQRMSAATTRERVEALAALADELRADAQDHCDEPKYVSQVARDFDDLTRDLVAAAEALSAAERARVLPDVAERFLRPMESSAARLASAWRARRPEAARSMDGMAKSAEQAIRRLRELSQA